MDPTKPQYVPAVDFYRSVAVSFDLGAKLVALAVLRPDATLNDRPIFLADIVTVEKAKTAIALFRARRARQLDNVKELAHA